MSVTDVQRNAPAELRSSVLALTTPQSITFDSVDPETGVRTHQTRLRAALLDELERAVGASIGRGGGGGGRGTVGIPLDGRAFDLLARIRRSLDQDWRRVAGPQPHRHPTTATRLTAWHRAFMSTGPVAAECEVWSRTLDEWAASIRSLLAPTRLREVLAPCPLCGAERTESASDEGAVRALVVMLPVEAEPTLECRACSHVIASGVRGVAWAA